jgi:Peptidase of plants and bacteria
MPPPFPRPPGKSPTPSPPYHDHPTPVLRLKIQDLSAPGAHSFLSTVDASRILKTSVHAVLDLLYPSPYRQTWPGSRSVTLVLSDFGGVAYTQGTSLDNDHKEIHFSTNYISSIAPELLEREITGVIVHEMVHCWQWDGCGTAPGGLIEGFADWARLRANLSPPHWKRRSGDRWDAGYEVTAWFLDWLEDKYGPGTVPRLNHMLKDIKYEEDSYWGDRCGLHGNVQELWDEYKKWLAEKDQAEKGKLEEEEKWDEKVGEKKKGEKMEDEAKEEKIAEEISKKDSGRGDRHSTAVENSGTNASQQEQERLETSEENDNDDDNNNTSAANDKSELDNGWTELSSGGLELPRRSIDFASQLN